MYIYAVKISNFRCFENKTIFTFKKGLNVLVGENDSGKSALIDAIKYVLGTTDQNWQRVNLTDYSNEDTSKPINITIIFSDLTLEEKATFMECLTLNNGKYYLILNWEAKYLTTIMPNRTVINLSCGLKKDITAPSPEARETLRATYLRPLRDAAAQMKAGRNSRLSQIVSSIPNLNDGKPYVPGKDISDLSLSGIFDLSNDLLKNNNKIKEVNNSINNIMSGQMLLSNENIQTDISVSNTDAVENKKINNLLEKLDLTVISNKGNIGLGTSNLMSMACELLLNNKNNNYSSFMLIEEPEAHIHAQRQLKLIKSIQEQCNKSDINTQVIMTTHSPLLSSVVHLENITIVNNKQPYSLSPNKTKLENNDYKYLEKYLDATKANMFFARGVIIVEGPAEALLFPTIAELLGYDFTNNGISLVDVRGIGLRRYARIFQRTDENNLLNVPVACVTDRDIMPDCAPKICINKDYSTLDTFPSKNKRRWKVESEIDDINSYMESILSRADGQNVKTFISDYWTLEYDLAYSGLAEDMIIVIENLLGKSVDAIKNEYDKYTTPEEKASYIYSFFRKNLISKADFAQTFSVYLEEKYHNSIETFKSKLPNYIVDAIEYVSTPIQ